MQRSSVFASSFVRVIDGGQVAFAGAGAGQQWPIVTGRDLRPPCLCQLEGATVLTVDRRAPAHSRFVVGGVIGVTILLALLVRFLFINQVSGDYRTFVSPWYDQLRSGGFAALGGDFSNYNPPYLYLLAAVTYLPVPKIIAIKGISMVFDVLLAIFAALIVRERFPRPALPLVTFAVGAVRADGRGQQLGVGAVRFDLRRVLPRQPVFPDHPQTMVGLRVLRTRPVVQAAGDLLPAGAAHRAGGQQATSRGCSRCWRCPAVFAVMLLPAALAGRDCPACW